MKLIDLLVQELPKLGGWPRGAAECVRYPHQGCVNFYDNDGNWPEDCGEKYGYGFAKCLIEPRAFGEKARTEVVTLEQYEAALAASKQVEWDGKTLPTCGTKCEWQDTNTKVWIPVSVVYSSEWVTVIREDAENDAVELAIENFGDEARRQFRPLCTEAERKRDDAIEYLLSLIDKPISDAALADSIYEAIAAGKIPGIKLAD